MRRRGHEGTKVWHNPDVDSPARRRRDAAGGQSSAEDRGEAKKHRAALEALFAPRKDAEESGPSADASAANAGRSKGSSSAADGSRSGAMRAPGRIVLSAPPASDAKAADRQRLLGKLLFADGPTQISKAANDFEKAGFTFPQEQDVYLQLLEHTDEARVRAAIDVLERLIAAELPKRRTVLESRLRRIEQFAEEEPTRAAAERLRRAVSGRPDPKGFLGRPS